MFKLLRGLFTPTKHGEPRDLFSDEVTTLARRLPNVAEVTRVEGAFALDIVATSGGQHRMFLDNAFAETRELPPDERAARIAWHFARIGDARDSSWQASRSLVAPVVRGATYGIELWAADPALQMLRRPFVPFVDAMVVIDLPTSMSYVNAKSVADWGIGEDEVFAAVAQRLDDLASVEVSLYDRDQGPLWHVTSNDTYETSRLLVAGWLASFAGKVEGRPIAIMPERATLMIAGDARPAMISRLLAKADREYRASNRRISPALYTIDDDGAVIPFRRPDGAPLASELAIAHEKLALEEYDIQKNVLDQLDEEVFVATYTAYVREGRALSLSVWTENVATHLPRTDVVVLLVPGAREDDEPRELIEAPWDAVAHRLKPVPGLYPPRFAALDFPDENERRRFTRVSG